MTVVKFYWANLMTALNRKQIFIDKIQKQLYNIEV